MTATHEAVATGADDDAREDARAEVSDSDSDNGDSNDDNDNDGHGDGEGNKRRRRTKSDKARQRAMQNEMLIKLHELARFTFDASSRLNMMSSRLPAKIYAELRKLLDASLKEVVKVAGVESAYQVEDSAAEILMAESGITSTLARQVRELAKAVDLDDTQRRVVRKSMKTVWQNFNLASGILAGEIEAQIANSEED